MNVQLNQIAVALFLLINLIIGLRAGRGIKTMRDYALANRSLGGGVLVMTLIATLIQANTIGIKHAYARGVISLLATFLLSLMSFLLGHLVFPKLTLFKNHYTIGDVMGELYGTAGRMVTVVTSTFFSLLIIVLQLVAFGQLSSLLGLPPRVSILIMGLLITLYTCFGGIRSVATTDVLQFICIVIGVVSFTSVALIKVGGFSLLFDKLPAKGSYLSFWNCPNFSQRILIAFFWSIWPTFLISPPVVQRILMAKNENQVKHMFLGFAIFYPFFRILLLLVGLCLATMKIPVETIFSFGFIIRAISNNPVVCIFFLLAIVAIIMSTVDSFLNALAILWVNDVIQPLAKSYNRTLPVLGSTRLASLVLGITFTCSAILFVAPANEILGYSVMIFSIIGFPFVAGVMGLKGSKKAFLASIAIFFISFLTWVFIIPYTKTFFSFLINTFARQGEAAKLGFTGNYFQILRLAWFFSIILSAIAFLVTHYIENGGFVIITRKSNMMKIHKSYGLTKASFQWLLAPVQWANEKAKRYGKEPYLLGLFICISYMVPYFTPDNSVQTILIISTLRGIGIVLCTLLLLESIWAKFLRPYFHLFYFITILYCVPFVSIMSSLNDPQGFFTVMNIVLSMILLIVLVDWRSFLLMEGISLLASLCLHKMWHGSFLPIFEINGGFVLGMSVLYTFLVCILFARKKEVGTIRFASNLLARNKSQELQLLVHADGQTQLAGSLDKKSSMMRELQNVAKALKSKDKPMSTEEYALRIENAVEHLHQMGQMSREYLPIKPANASLNAMLQTVAHALVKAGIDPSEKVRIKLQQQQDKIVCDAPYIENLIYNSTLFLVKKYPDAVVTLVVRDTKLDYNLPTNGSKDKLFSAWHLTFFVTDEEVATQAIYLNKTTQLTIIHSDLKMQENARIVQAHYGLMHFDKQGKSDLQSYVLPLDLRSIRPKIQKFADEDLLQKTRLDSEEDKVFIHAVSQQKGTQ